MFGHFKMIQDYITYNNFLGIPLDILAHIFVSILVSLILLKIKFRMKFVIFFILVLAINKEILDFYLKDQFDYMESAKDIIVTMLYPCLIAKTRKLKKKSLARELDQ